MKKRILYLLLALVLVLALSVPALAAETFYPVSVDEYTAGELDEPRINKVYRLSLSKGREVISLAEELRHAQLYVEIQNLRFENRILATWDTDASADRCQIIKIVLQPIIENAILHGIFEKPSKSGHLNVRVRRYDDGIRITVEDDGVGMDQKTLAESFSRITPPGHATVSGGYGIRNIAERLTLAYGSPYGLSCESSPGKGTTVTVHIPAILPEEEQEES